MSGRLARVTLAAACVMVTACSSGRSTSTPAQTPATPAARVPTTAAVSTSGGPTTATPVAAPGHVVVVVMENKPYSAIVGRAGAPYLNALARSGTSFTSLHAIRHPSQPNYIGLFSGSTHGVTDDSCPQHLTGPNLASQLRRAGLSFAGYSEGLPRAGDTVCTTGAYARKHAPWTNFPALGASVNKPFSAFPSDFATLPTVAWVIPDLDHDMHDGTVAQADAWTRRHLSRYATWARSHHSVLIVTWDEDDHTDGNRIPTFVVGADVPAREVGTKVTLYSLLRAMEDRYGLPRLGAAASAPPLSVP